LKRFIAIILAAGTLALSGCSTVTKLVPGSVVNVAEVASLISLNPDVVTTADAEKFASEIANLTSEQFYELDANGQLVENKDFGTVTLDSQSPFTVTYEVAEGRKWSDGQPIDAADLALSFAAATNPGGSNFFSLRAGAGLQYATVKTVGVRSLTLTFSQPIPAWKTILPVYVPAHVVAGAAFDGVTPARGKAMVIEALQSKDSTKLQKLADAYRSVYYSAFSAPKNNAFVSSGAYSIASVLKDTSVTLKANRGFQGLHGPVAETVNLKLYSDSMAALNDMNTGSVDIIGATESGLVKYSDLVNMVSSLSTMKASTALRNGSSADMVLFNFGKDGALNSPELRKAFMLQVPKAQIVAQASQDAQVASADSFVYPSNSSYYESSVGSNGSSGYLMQDVEQAGKIVKAAAKHHPLDVRVVYDSSNPRSVAEYKLIASRAASAGFNLIDMSSADPTRDLLAGNFDVYVGPRLLVGEVGQDPTSLVADRVTRYTDSQVSSLLIDYAKATKPVNAAKALAKIDARLYTTGYGLPLYQVPNLLIYRTKLGKIELSPFGDSATWGYWTWSVSTK